MLAGIRPVAASPSDSSLYTARRARSHPTAYDSNPPFICAPRLNDDTHLREAGLFGVRAGRQLRQRRVSESTVTAAFGEDVSSPYARLAASLVGVLDTKELFEALEMFERTRKRLACSTVVDACGGHGLVGLLFAAYSKPCTAVTLLDVRKPASYDAIYDAVCTVAPWVRTKLIRYIEADIRQLAPPEYDACAVRELLVPNAPSPHGVAVTAVHACGGLTDTCLSLGIALQAQAMAALPCCFTGTATVGVPYGVRRVLGVGLAADCRRAFELEAAGYAVDFAAVPQVVTPVNRILVAVKRHRPE